MRRPKMAVLVGVVAAVAGLAAADSTLQLAVDANWTDPGWVLTGGGATVYPNGVGEIARLDSLNDDANINRIYYLDQNITLGQLYMYYRPWGSSVDLLPVLGSEVLTFNNGGSAATLYLAQIWPSPKTRTVGVNMDLVSDLTVIEDGYSFAKLTGNITGNGKITAQVGLGGTLTLAGQNTFAGGVDLVGGTLQAVGASALGTGAVTFVGPFTTGSGNTATSMTTPILDLRSDDAEADFGVNVVLTQSGRINVDCATLATGGFVKVGSLNIANDKTLVVTGSHNYGLVVQGALTIGDVARIRTASGGSNLTLAGGITGGPSSQLYLYATGGRTIINTAEGANFQGTVRVSGTGGIGLVLIDDGILTGAKEIQVAPGAVLDVNNNGSAVLSDRIGDSTVLNLRGGGIAFRNDLAGADANEYIGVLKLSASESYILMPPPLAGTSSILQFGSLERSVGATMMVQGGNSNYGIAGSAYYNGHPGGNVSRQITFDTVPAMSYGIIPGVIIYDGVWGSASKLPATYVPEIGLTSAFSGYTDYIDPNYVYTSMVGRAYDGSDPNLAYDANAFNETMVYYPWDNWNTTLVKDTDLNAIWLEQYVSPRIMFDLAGFKLTLHSGMMSTSWGAATMKNGNLTSASGEIILYSESGGSRMWQIDANIIDNGEQPVAVVCSTGYGGSILTGQNTYSGGTFISSYGTIYGQATTEANNPKALGTGPVHMGGGRLIVENDVPMFLGNDVIVEVPAAGSVGQWNVLWARPFASTTMRDPNFAATDVHTFGALTFLPETGLTFVSGNSGGGGTMGLKFVGTTTLQGGEDTFFIDTYTRVYLAGKVTGAGKLVLRTNGGTSSILTLSGAGNDWTGGTEVYNGRLVVAAGSDLGNGGVLYVGSGAAVTAPRIQNATDVTLNGPVILTGSQLTSVVSTLTINGSTYLDLGSGLLVVKNGNLAAIEAQVTRGMNMASGYWNGPGIRSSTAAADTNFYTGIGVLDNSLAGFTEFGSATGLTGSEILVRYTFYGDADLSGTVDFDNDYILWQEGFLNGYTGWVYGDFDHNGVVDFDNDYILWQTVFLNQPSLPGGAAAVPEPGTLALIGLGLAGLLGRRNRK